MNGPCKRSLNSRLINNICSAAETLSSHRNTYKRNFFFFFVILLSNFKGQYLPIAKYRGTKHVVARSSAVVRYSPEKLASNDIQTSKAGIAAGEAC